MNKLSVLGELREIRRSCEKLIEKIEAEPHRFDAIGMIDQTNSPDLGPRRHCASVRRRVAMAEARGISPTEVGAAIIGRRHLLTPEALAEEVSLLSGPGIKRTLPRPPGIDDDEQAAYEAIMRRYPSANQ